MRSRAQTSPTPTPLLPPPARTWRERRAELRREARVLVLAGDRKARPPRGARGRRGGVRRLVRAVRKETHRHRSGVRRVRQGGRAPRRR